MAPCVVGRGGGGARGWLSSVAGPGVCAGALCIAHAPRPGLCTTPDPPRRHDARLRGSRGCVERPRVAVRLSALRRGAGGDVDDKFVCPPPQRTDLSLAPLRGLPRANAGCCCCSRCSPPLDSRPNQNIGPDRRRARSIRTNPRRAATAGRRALRDSRQSPPRGCYEPDFGLDFDGPASPPTPFLHTPCRRDHIRLGRMTGGSAPSRCLTSPSTRRGGFRRSGAEDLRPSATNGGLPSLSCKSWGVSMAPSGAREWH